MIVVVAAKLKRTNRLDPGAPLRLNSPWNRCACRFSRCGCGESSVGCGFRRAALDANDGLPASKGAAMRKNIDRGLRLLVALPCLNEEATLGAVLQGIPARIDGVREIQAVVVDDGSTDRSGEIARQHEATVLRHPVNRGVGAAFQTATEHAVLHGFDAMVWIDADGQFSPSEIPDLLAPLLRGEADMVTASRFRDPLLVPEMPRLKRVGNWAMARVISFLVGKRFADVSCGFRALSLEALLRLDLHGRFTYTQETFLDLCFKGMAIVEVPVRVRYFPGRRSRVAGNLLMYGLRTLSIIIDCYRNYFPLRFYGILGTLLILAGAVPLGYMLGEDLDGRPPGMLVAGGMLGGLAMVVGAACLATAFSGSILDRVRAAQERQLYLLRRQTALSAAARHAERPRLLLHPRSAAELHEGEIAASDQPGQVARDDKGHAAAQ